MIEGPWHESEPGIGGGRTGRGRARWAGRRQLHLAQLAETLVRIADLELDSPSRRAEAVLRDGDPRLLADDVASQVDPPPAVKLQTDAGRLRERSVDRS